MAVDRRLEAIRRELARRLNEPQPTVLSAALDYLGGKLPGRLGAMLRRVGQLAQTTPVESVTGAVPPVAAGSLVWKAGGREFAGPVYHGTTTGLLESIMREGLRPWKEIGERVGTVWTAKEIPRRAGVYFARDPARAWDIARLAADTRASFRLPGAGEPVVLRVQQLPTSRLLQDEDISGIARWKRLRGKDVPSGWRSSFVMKTGQLEDVIDRAFSRAEATLRGAELQRVLDVLDALFKRRRQGEAFSGIGSAAYKGRIPPEQIEAVGTTKEAVLGEREALHDRLARLLVDTIRRGEDVPWWLR